MIRGFFTEGKMGEIRYPKKTIQENTDSLFQQ